MERVNKMGFEIETCTRCGGSGKHSFNLMHADRCYGCGGTGVRLTKRGSAAKMFYINAQTRPVSELKAGMHVWSDGRFWPVLAIESSASSALAADGTQTPYVNIVMKRYTWGVFQTSTVRFVRDEADRLETLAQAIAYQATLTKTGKPSKVAV